MSLNELTLPKKIELLRRMLLIRCMEEQLGELVKRGDIPGGVHLYIGQEAVASGVCAHLTDQDWIASNHRGHGHFLAKGGDPHAMAAEILGRETGICHGKGGSMHVADFSRGILGANGIVGGGVGIALGAALAAQLDEKQRVAVVFFGDGAASQGIVAEALNMAALWKLPALLVCENNGFSEFSRGETVTAGEIWRRAEPYGIPACHIDGNDVIAVWEAARVAIERARSGAGATLIEARTYRWRGHMETEKSFLAYNYREDAEIVEWQARDPIERLAGAVLADLGEEKLSALRAEALVIAADAFERALEDPYPPISRAFEDMFANE
jgi:acetoin:2,6-dichlorophenolindophenol oxidoreductase subunit alpha